MDWIKLFEGTHKTEMYILLGDTYPKCYRDIILSGKFIDVVDSSGKIWYKDVGIYSHFSFIPFIIQMQKDDQTKWFNKQQHEIESCINVDILRTKKLTLQQMFNASHVIELTKVPTNIRSSGNHTKFLITDDEVIFEDYDLYDLIEDKIRELSFTSSKASHMPEPEERREEIDDKLLKHAKHKIALLHYLGVFDFIRKENPQFKNDNTGLSKLICEFLSDIPQNTVCRCLDGIEKPTEKNNTLSKNARNKVKQVFNIFGLDTDNIM